MCGNCGCGIVDGVKIESAQLKSDHEHTHHEHTHHEHTHHHHSLTLNQAILHKNDHLAAHNRDYFAEHHLLVLNVLSSPGSGKTTFLTKMIADLQNKLKFGVIVGDLETDRDAQRLRSSGANAIQITTGTVCHLEANMVMQAAQQFNNIDDVDILAIENVGNLVCPAAYDLGENLRIVLLSVTEGEDKPLKYPTTFKSADVVIVNKIDIAEAIGFAREEALANIQGIAPQAHIFEVSARTGAGMESWYSYLSTVISQQLTASDGEARGLI